MRLQRQKCFLSSEQAEVNKYSYFVKVTPSVFCNAQPACDRHFPTVNSGIYFVI